MYDTMSYLHRDVCMCYIQRVNSLFTSNKHNSGDKNEQSDQSETILIYNFKYFLVLLFKLHTAL
ncbi:hypothetical protein BDQ17DRAFT_1382372, partial [Cyathus striatus]